MPGICSQNFLPDTDGLGKIAFEIGVDAREILFLERLGRHLAAALAAGEVVAAPPPERDLAPASLQELLTRLELADRLAERGYGLSVVELAQLVQMPLRQLEGKTDAWNWRDWLVQPAGDGRWRLARATPGLGVRE